MRSSLGVLLISAALLVGGVEHAVAVGGGAGRGGGSGIGARGPGLGASWRGASGERRGGVRAGYGERGREFARFGRARRGDGRFFGGYGYGGLSASSEDVGRGSAECCRNAYPNAVGIRPAPVEAPVVYVVGATQRTARAGGTIRRSSQRGRASYASSEDAAPRGTGGRFLEVR